MHPDQIEWFREQNNLIDAADRSKGHGFLFMHIPMIEYVNLYNDFNYYGTRGEEICCWSVNTGMFGALVEQPTIEWVTVGHDHN
ncbi:MAG: metallophosphatase, partial [bacterium]